MARFVTENHRVRRRRRRPKPFECRVCGVHVPRYAGPLGWICSPCLADLAVKDDLPGLQPEPKEKHND